MSYTETETATEFIQQRLENLSLIDEKIISILDHVSDTLETVKEGQINELKQKNNEEVQVKFKQSVRNFYKDLEFMASRLRREIILMDKKTGLNSSENDVSLLTSSIDKKASWIGDWNFKKQIQNVKTLLNEDPDYEKRFEFVRVERKPKAESKSPRDHSDDGNEGDDFDDDDDIFGEKQESQANEEVQEVAVKSENTPKPEIPVTKEPKEDGEMGTETKPQVVESLPVKQEPVTEPVVGQVKNSEEKDANKEGSKTGNKEENQQVVEIDDFEDSFDDELMILGDNNDDFELL